MYHQVSLSYPTTSPYLTFRTPAKGSSQLSLFTIIFPSYVTYPSLPHPLYLICDCLIC
uniref:Uncharacterized protein n=2 Tax=Meloidogyne TaxID=189290 RepID=A0A6V7U3I3_MELEN|nr:unnamed protein product [Meloidogyne enterolobii]